MVTVDNVIYSEQIKQAMNKYGYIHYDFKEPSAPFVDKKSGSNMSLSVGSISKGLDDRGYDSLVLNSNFLVINKAMPTGEVAVSFRLKTTYNADYGNIINSTEASSERGFLIGTTSSGTIRAYATYGVSGQNSFNVEGTTKINDGNWHDVLFSWNGLVGSNNVKMYIDGKLEFEASSVQPNSSHTRTTISIGRSGASNTYFYNGEISNLQIYNKALTLEDFHFNKTLILHDGEYKKWYEKMVVDEVISIAMTSNTTPAPYVVSSSSVLPPYEDWKAFSGTNIDDNDSWHTGSGTNQWIKFKFSEKTKVKGVILTTRNIGDPNNSWFPKNYTIEGSNDDVSYVPLFTVTNLDVTGANIENKHIFDDVADYMYYRVYIANAGRTYICIGKIEFIKATTQEDVTGWINSSLQLIQTEGMDSLSPLLDRRVETLEPLPMTDKSEILSGDEVGKVFSKKLDLNKYLDIRSIKVEVR